MKKLILSSGIEVSVSVFKMYVPDPKKVKKYSSNFINSINQRTNLFKKIKGWHPAGYVVELEFSPEDYIRTVGLGKSSEVSFVYGVSAKSPSDEWNRKRGLGLAYSNLLSSLAYTSLYPQLTREDKLRLSQVIFD